MRLPKSTRWRRLRAALWRCHKQRWTHAAGAARRRAKNLADGLCEVAGCGEKALNKTHCEKHRVLAREACARYRRSLADAKYARLVQAWMDYWNSPQGRAELAAADASAARANWPGESDPV
jgi:hypothetical protein